MIARAAGALGRLALWLGVAVVTAVALAAMGLLYLFLTGVGAVLDRLTAWSGRAAKRPPPGLTRRKTSRYNGTYRGRKRPLCVSCGCPYRGRMAGGGRAP